ncbi:hypothetical protein [Candidatus Nitrospira bockiana]
MRLITTLWSLVLSLVPAAAWAEEVHAYSRGNAFVYFTMIAFILIYGIHDAFRNRMLTSVSAVVILVTLYLLLPAS